MILAYYINEENELEKVELESSDPIPKKAVWVDLVEPSLEEEKAVEKALKIDAPTREEMDKIEVMSPFYKEGNSYYMTITAIHKHDKDYPESTALSFILHPKCLVTLRYSKPKAFNYFVGRARRDCKLIQSPDMAVEGLLESLVHSLADVLEKTGNELDQLLIDVFEKPKQQPIKKSGRGKKQVQEPIPPNDHYYTSIIKKVGQSGNLISKIRESLVSLNRTLIFFGQIDEGRYIAKKEHRVRFRNLSREIHSLTEYANFLAQRNSFLLDATLGMINVEQNMIIKVFTVAAAVFFPPTLIASIYGMNFKHMPELSSMMGYPFALILMLLSGALPYYYFKRKGWL